MLLFRFKILLNCFLFLFLLTSCSYTPMYGENSNSNSVLNKIYIEDAQNRNDQIVRNELIRYLSDNINNNNNPLELSFHTKVSEKPLLLSTSGEAKRIQIHFTMVYNIYRVNMYKELIYSNEINLFNTYTASDSEYNNARAAVKTYELVAKEGAKQMVEQISLNYLSLIE